MPRQDCQSSTKFYQEDVVESVANPSTYGVVLRCWHDTDDMPPLHALNAPNELDPLLRPLNRDEVGVSFFPDNRREIRQESDFTLVDRFFQPGDVCKRSIHDVQSGVVASVDVQFQVAHVISNKLIDEWKSIKDVQKFPDVSVGDYVACDDWIGQVQEMFDESIVQVADGQLVRVPELSAHLSVGERGSDILPASGGSNMPGVLAMLMGHTQPSTTDTVVAVKHTVLAVAWMAINQSLTPEEAAKRARPQRFWHGADLHRLTLLRGLSDMVVHLGDKLTLKDCPSDTITKHGRDSAQGFVEVDVFMVVRTRTTVKVIWQDGSEESVRSTDLIPYLNPDEYDCWPGDHAVWKNEEERQAGVVQSTNAQERTALLLLADGRRQLVPVLELDVHGTDSALGDPQAGYGVRRGDLVFIHREGTTNGCEMPLVPSIGELEAWVHEHIVDDHGELGGWQKEMDAIGQKIAHARGKEAVVQGEVVTSRTDSSLNWFGEVAHLHLDGNVELLLPDRSIAVVPLQRLTKLIDGIEQLEDMWGDELEDDAHMHDMAYTDSEGDEIVEIQTEDGQWHHYHGVGDDEDEWVEDEVDESSQMDVDEEQTTSSITPEEADLSTNGVEKSISDAPKLSSSSSYLEDSPEQESEWKRFDILPTAPVDHAYYSTTPSQPSRAFLSRLQKEYRALSNSLPESIIVRAYEDRSDLLRCLIIGPENTPYEDAPFVIDWMLDSDFPQSPPLAHFLSWTNGNGRVNPNLYEEGKVCLSILGTWAGDKSESWSPTRSTLLQALVSIQGLVLVKEPWFCEPAYEKWRGTDEGKVNSRLYSEKAYILSRGFVRRALEIPLGGGFDEVVKNIYYTKGRLRKVVESSRWLVESSKNVKEGEENDEVAVPKLTPGGIIMLTRTLDKLEAFLLSASEQSPEVSMEPTSSSS